MLFLKGFGITETVNIEKVYASSSEVNIIYLDDKGNTLDSVSTTTETTLTTTTAEELYAKNIQGYSYVSNTVTSSSASSSGLSCNYDSSSGRKSIFTSNISHCIA